MKKIGLFLVVGLLSVFFISGCASTRSAGMKTTPDGGVYYEGQGVPIVYSPPGPVQVATGAAIITRANSELEFNRALASLIRARAESIKNGVPNQDVSSKKFLVVVINDALNKVLHFDDPRLKKVYDVVVGDHQFFSADRMPKKITYWYTGSTRKKTAKVKEGPDKYNEIPVDSVIRISR